MRRTFILAGQSNMAGGVIREELPKSHSHWPDYIMCYGPDGAFCPLDDERCGPELGFAQQLHEEFPDERFAIVKYGIGGSNLANEWSPDESIRQLDEPEQRLHCFAALKKAMQHAVSAEETRWCGFAWMQGERDSVWKGMAHAYGDHLLALVDAMCSETQVTDLPFAIGRIAPRCMTPDGLGFRHAYRNLVRVAQESFCHSQPNATLVDCDDLPQRADALHFVTPACLELGRRFAKALL